jgi:hypothetical protein
MMMKMNRMNSMSTTYFLPSKKYIVVLATILFFCSTAIVHAATLSISPGTGVYTSGQTFTASVVVNTQGKPINAAEGTISFNPSQLSVVSVTKGSLFNLWTAEPSFSNSAGTISFSGGNPAGYTGGNGVVLSVTFRAVGSGSARVSLANASVLAADGRGTNVLTAMNSGTYTISAQSSTPEPERIVEYVAPANTPSAPVVTSPTHPDTNSWYQSKTVELRWSVPAGVTGVRTLLDRSPSSVPTRVYESAISNLSLEDVDEGTSYFHIQFRNDEGWGRVAHYKISIDSIAPTNFMLALPEDADLSSPTQILSYKIDEASSRIALFKVQIDGGEAITIEPDEAASSTIALPVLSPGYHTVIVEAYDEAGNSTIASLSFTIFAFDKPYFTEFPERVSPNVIPVFKGLTRPGSTVEALFTRVGFGISSSDNTQVYQVVSETDGSFTIIPDGRLAAGVYEVTLQATDAFGAQSELSDVRRLIVEEPGYIRLGTYAISLLSVVIPLLAMSVLMVLSLWFVLVRARRMRTGVVRESKEASAILLREFSELTKLLEGQKRTLVESRKTNKLTKGESELLDNLSSALTTAKQRVLKEIDDVTDIVD